MVGKHSLYTVDSSGLSDRATKSWHFSTMLKISSGKIKLFKIDSIKNLTKHGGSVRPLQLEFDRRGARCNSIQCGCAHTTTGQHHLSAFFHTNVSRHTTSIWEHKNIILARGSPIQLLGTILNFRYIVLIMFYQNQTWRTTDITVSSSLI